MVFTQFHIIHYHFSHISSMCLLSTIAHWSEVFIELFTVMLRFISVMLVQWWGSFSVMLGFISWADMINSEACEWYEHLKCLPSVLDVLYVITADFHLSLCFLFINIYIIQKIIFLD